MLDGSYNSLLVFLSLVVAILASYTALIMAERVYLSEPKAARWWHFGGACAMGVGIWSMHFIGMLAFSLPIALAYDLTLTLLSLVFAMAVSYFALWQVTGEGLSKARLAIAAVLMGLGISAMHYTGMEAMQMFPAIQYKPSLFVLSVLIAIAASGAALYIISWLRGGGDKKYYHITHLVAATVMGVAIVGMHYTGMLAAQFPAGSICRAVGTGLQAGSLTILVGLGSLFVLFVANVTSNFSTKTDFLIKSLETVNQQLKQQSLYDPLTQLPNRVLLEERVEQLIKRAVLNDKSFVFMVIDLDGFKAVNDSLGAQVGDALVEIVASKIRQVVAEQYTVARPVGNEFVVLVDAGVAEAADLAGLILEGVRQPITINHSELAMTASVGMAVYPADGLSYGDLAYHADAAMRFRKRTGKNGYNFYEGGMNADATRKLALISNLRSAIARNQLNLYFQPKFDLKTGRVIGAEALLRWQHPMLGFISPAEFIPIAEESGLIVDLDHWVLSQACQQLRIWRMAGYSQLNIAINVSAAQFANTELIDNLVDTLETWSIPFDALSIEVTETTAMHNPEASLSILNQLSELGVKVAIDDFGTGYSSLLYLKRLPADELKVDRAFVKLLGQDNDDERIVSAVIALGHQFGMKVVAEGVETEEQKRLLEEYHQHQMYRDIIDTA